MFILSYGLSASLSLMTCKPQAHYHLIEEVKDPNKIKSFYSLSLKKIKIKKTKTKQPKQQQDREERSNNKTPNAKGGAGITLYSFI